MMGISCGLRDGARAGCPPGVRSGWEEPEVMQGRKELGWVDVGPGGDRSTSCPTWTHLYIAQEQIHQAAQQCPAAGPSTC